MALFSGDRSVSSDQSGEDSTHGLDTERQRSNVEKEDIFDITSQDSTLDGGTDCNGLVGVDTSVRLLVEEALHGLTNLWDSA